MSDQTPDQTSEQTGSLSLSEQIALARTDPMSAMTEAGAAFYLDAVETMARHDCDSTSWEGRFDSMSDSAPHHAHFLRHAQGRIDALIAADIIVLPSEPSPRPFSESDD